MLTLEAQNPSDDQSIGDLRRYSCDKVDAAENQSYELPRPNTVENRLRGHSRLAIRCAVVEAEGNGKDGNHAEEL